MCGAFAVAVSAAGAGRAAAVARRQAGYVLGKATSYATLGLAISGGAGRIAAAGAPSVCAWVAGAVLIALGLRQLGLLPRRRAGLPASSERWLAPLGRLVSELQRLPGFAGAFGAGAANGLLPCGLTFGALALAASASPAAALLGPFLFGLATAPALLAVGLGAWLVRGAPPVSLRRRLAPVWLGLALITGGVFTGLRGAPGVEAIPCCESPP
jgi:sulfite exporter TauE/SafE